MSDLESLLNLRFVLQTGTVLGPVPPQMGPLAVNAR